MRVRMNDVNRRNIGMRDRANARRLRAKKFHAGTSRVFFEMSRSLQNFFSARRRIFFHPAATSFVMLPSKGSTVMRNIICTLAVLLVGLVTPAAHADQQRTAAPKPIATIRTALIEPAPTVTRGQIAACANLAAIRALDAKAAGAGYPAQSRILDLTFVLCLAGSPAAD